MGAIIHPDTAVFGVPPDIARNVCFISEQRLVRTLTLAGRKVFVRTSTPAVRYFLLIAISRRVLYLLTWTS
jgi:hypothetical protein